jgi:hypothetical protein
MLGCAAGGGGGGGLAPSFSDWANAGRDPNTIVIAKSHVLKNKLALEEVDA